MPAREPGPARGRPSTPGLLGYALAWIASVVAVIALTGGWLVAEAVVDIAAGTAGADSLLVALEWTVLTGYFATFWSAPFALVGIPLVHLLCRRIGAQWVHVLAAGGAGLLPLVLMRVLVGEWELGWALVAACTALGRLAVVPVVWRRRAAVAVVPARAR